MFDAAVTGEIEHGFLAKPGHIKIAIVHEEFVGLSCRFSRDPTIRIDDHGTCHAVMAILDAALGDRYYPGRVLIGASLQRKLVVKHSLFRSFIAVLRVDRRRVETEHDNLDALQAKVSSLGADHYVPNLLRNFTDASRADELEAFASTNLPPQAAPSVAKASDEIRFKSEFKQRLLPEFANWIEASALKAQR